MRISGTVFCIFLGTLFSSGIFSLDILCVCEYVILDVPILNFKSPDVATTSTSRLLFNREDDLLNSLVIPVPI